MIPTTIRDQDLFPHWSLHPKMYVAPYTPTPLPLDGNLDAWSSVPWSTYFGDIGGDDHLAPSPSCSTRIKMMWDENYLYILGSMESSRPVIATFTQRNSPIFHQDADFEVFVDPSNSCHGYKELEMNALNTVWNLLLDKPYSDGGKEHSGRIASPGESLYYDVVGQQTLVHVLQGTLNDPSTHQQNTWMVEIALKHEDTCKNLPDMRIRTTSPRMGDLWRINFSRVEDRGNINWTWQPQIVWDPEKLIHQGQVNMHLPDAWGYVRFGPTLDPGNVASLFGEISIQDILDRKGDVHWPGKLTAMNIYYSQHYYKRMFGEFASSWKDLQKWVDPHIVQPFHDSVVNWFADAEVFQISILDQNQLYLHEITQDRFLTMIETTSNNKAAIE